MENCHRLCAPVMCSLFNTGRKWRLWWLCPPRSCRDAAMPHWLLWKQHKVILTWFGAGGSPRNVAGKPFFCILSPLFLLAKQCTLLLRTGGRNVLCRLLDRAEGGLCYFIFSFHAKIGLKTVFIGTIIWILIIETFVPMSFVVSSLFLYMLVLIYGILILREAMLRCIL